MTNSKFKLAILRDDDSGPKCPFGLPIPYGCKNAGKLVEKMPPISEVPKEQVKDIENFNKRLLAWEASEEQCRFAIEISKGKTECCFGENDSDAVSTKGLNNSTFYSKVYNNVAYDGLYSYPMGNYGDENISRNLYYGLYSLQGSSNQEKVEKFAELIEFLNENLPSLPEDVKNILFNFASDHANNEELLKTASIAPKFNNVLNILRIWKDNK
jgi:hypothetical protein